MSSWVDRLWDLKPGAPAISPNSKLTKQEKAILLSFAQGGNNSDAAIAASVTEGSFKGTHLLQLQAKLFAKAAPRVVKRAYMEGALVVEYEPETTPPTGARDLIPEDLLAIQHQIADGYNNKEIGERLSLSEGTVRSKVLKLGQGLMVARGIGGRTQIVSRGFEFGIFSGAQWMPKGSSAIGR